MKKIKKAVALEYSVDSGAPKVVASGKGVIADAIINKAKEGNVPITKDENVIDNLIELELGQEIPPELYEAVAKILAFVCDVDKFVGERKN